MRELTPDERATRDRRRAALPGFVSSSKPALLDFAGRVNVEDPARIAADPDALLPVLDNFLRDEDLSGLPTDDLRWLQVTLTYFIGELMIARHRGRWMLQEDPGARFFLRYVIGDLQAPPTAGLVIDPISVASEYLALPPGRSLPALIDEIEGDIARTAGKDSGAARD